MGSQGPGDIPRVVRRRKARANRQPKRPPQPTPTEALKGRAYGSRPARPLPKPAPAPKPRAAPAPTPRQASRAAEQQYVSQGKAVAAQAYRSQSVAQRRKAVRKAWQTPEAQRTPEQKAAISIHHQRHAGDVKTAASRAQGARAQGAGYGSQALAVHNVATAKDAAAAAAAAAVKTDKKIRAKQGNVSVAGISFKPGALLKTIAKSARIPVAGGGVPYSVAKKITATPPGLKEAPVETALKQTQRGAYAVKAATLVDIKREGVAKGLFGVRSPGSKTAKEARKAAKRGFQLKQKTSGADILKAAGVKNKGVRAAGGLVVDVAAEGLTTPSFGVGSVGARTATKVARRAERAAARAGGERAVVRAAGERAAARVGTVTPAEAERAARSRLVGRAQGPLTKPQAKKVAKAGRRAARRQTETVGRGVAVKYLGHEVPGSRRATAAVGRGARKVTRKGPGKTDAERRVEQGAAHAIRTARVQKQAGHAEANRQAAAAHRMLHNDAEKSAVARAADTGNIRSLTPSWGKALKEAKGDKAAAKKIMERDHPDEVRLASAAQRLRSSLKGVHVAERQANVAERTVPDNFLTKGDHEKLKTTIKRQQAQAQKQVETARASGDAERLQRKLDRRDALNNIPQRGRGAGVPLDETHAAWLQRVHAHAEQHGLKRVVDRVEKLASKAPKPSEVAGGYFPRMTEDVAHKQFGIAPPKESPASVRTGTSRQATTRTGGKARKDVRKLSIVQAERDAAGLPPLTENPALAVGARIREGRTAVAESTFARNLAAQGRKVTHESQVREGEGLYMVGRKGGKDGKFGLHPADKVSKGKTPRQYVAIRHDVVEKANKANAAVPHFDNKALRVIDKITSGYKGVITRNPMFHMKNTIGDLHRLVFEVPAGGKVRSSVGAAKAARAIHQVERYQAGGKAPSAKVLGAKISLGRGEKVTAEELTKRLRRHGLIDAGRSVQEQLERELLSGRAAKEGDVLRTGTGQIKAGVERALNPQLLTQEAPNTIRTTAWIAGKRMGMSDAQAADFSHQFFVDYGKLTPGERQIGRRVAPFYTWTRQALPGTLKNFAANPARYGNMEAVRNEWNQMITGLSEDELNARMSKFARRQLPFIIPVGHDSKGNPQFKAVSANWAATLLNNLPTSTSLTDVVRGGGEGGLTVAGMLNPLFKTPLELASVMGGRGGHQLVTDRPIEDPFNPVKPAPAPEWIKYLPKSLKDELKVVPVDDPKTGKRVLGWRGKADYGYTRLPSVARRAIEAAYAVEHGSANRPGETRPGLTTILSGFGITADEVSAEVKKANARFEKVKELGEANRALKFLPAGVGKDNPTPEWRRLRAKVNRLSKELSPSTSKKTGGGIDIGLGGGSGPKVDIGLGGGPKQKIDIGLGG